MDISPQWYTSRINFGSLFWDFNFYNIYIYIYINDLPDFLNVDSNISLHADDAKLFGHLTTSQDVLLLQHDIN